MEVNQAYIAMKLWIMLVHRVNERGRGDVSMLAVWNELWGPYDSFLCVLEGEARAGLHRVSAANTLSRIGADSLCRC